MSELLAAWTDAWGDDVWIFDLDGTVLESNELDERAFEQAVLEVLPGLGEAGDGWGTDWGAYPDATDVVIVRALMDQAGLPSVLRSHVQAHFRRRFAELLRGRLRAGGVVAAPGVCELFGAIGKAKRGAVATGGYGVTAALKIRASGLGGCGMPGGGVLGVPVCSCDVADRRVEIIAAAARRLGVDWDDAGSGGRGRVVYFGDGLWDRSACEEAGIRFVGVALEEKAKGRLQEGHARPVIDGFGDVGVVVEAVKEAGEVLAGRG